MTSMRLRARAWRLGPTGRGRDEERKAKALREHQDGEFGGHSFPSVLGGSREETTLPENLGPGKNATNKTRARLRMVHTPR